MSSRLTSIVYFEIDSSSDVNLVENLAASSTSNYDALVVVATQLPELTGALGNLATKNLQAFQVVCDSSQSGKKPFADEICFR